MKNLFYLRKSDRIAVLSLLLVIVSAITLMYFFGSNESVTFVMENDNDSINVKCALERNYDSSDNKYYKVEERQRELFPFDPNTADSTQLLRLGLRPWQVRNIYKYRASGGIYRKSADFARLYGLTVKEYRELEPYIRISSEYQAASTLYIESQEDAVEVKSYPMKLKAGEQIDANVSDTTDLKKVPGIGSVYARAIVNYRERLGGFVEAGQLLEIKGFPESALPYLSINGSPYRKLNINKLSVSQLSRHPYISFYQAKDIVDYRRLHGNITSLQCLSLLKNFMASDITRLEPYVEY